MCQEFLFLLLFSLAGCQVPTKATLSLPLLSWTGERKHSERLVGQGEDREITWQLPSWAKLDLGKLGIYCQSNLRN